MTWGIFNDSLQTAGFAVSVVFTPICIIVTALRFFSTRMSLGKFGVEDWYALGALIFYIIWIVIQSLTVTNLNGAHNPLDLSEEQTTAVLLPLFIATLMFPPNQLCAKFSILFLYQRIFGVNKTYAFWIKVLGVLQVLYTIATMVTAICQCQPVYGFWRPQSTNGTCISSGAFLAGVEPVNSCIDFAMAILAIFMLRGLQTSRTTKLKLSLLFISGGLAGVIGFIKIGLAFSADVHNQIIMGVWATVQMALSIICCCAITFKPLFARLKVFSRLGSKITTYGSQIQFRRKPLVPSLFRESDDWINLDRGSGDRYRVATSVVTKQDNTSREDEYPTPRLPEGYQMKTIRVEQSIEHV